MQKLTRNCSNDCTFDSVYYFQYAYIIGTTIDYMHQLCFLYMLNYRVIYSLSSHLLTVERAAVNMQGKVFTLARLKIVPS